MSVGIRKMKFHAILVLAAVLGAAILTATVFASDDTPVFHFPFPAVPVIYTGGDTPTPTPTATPANTAVPTPTPIPPFTISGNVNYQGTGTHNVYVFMTDNNGGFYLSTPLPNNGFYSFTESPSSVQGFVLWACYDYTGNGLQLTPNYSGYGYPVEQGNGASLTNSGDVVCSVGYFGSCLMLGPGGGTHYTSDSTVNIVFGGTKGPQSGSNCN
jgi:hypothetical protein